MSNIVKITSTQNPKVKWLVKLREKANLRREEGLFVLEGLREIRLAAAHDYPIRELFLCPQLLSEEKMINIVKPGSHADVCEVSLPVYQKIAVRGTTEGLIAVAEKRDHNLAKLTLPAQPLLLVVEKVEKPGNLGALFRTADAAGLDAVIICDPTVDLYNPNVIRSSLGCLFTLKIAICSSEEALEWLRVNSVKSFAATPEGAEVYSKVDYKGASAVVVGSEAEGLTDIWMQKADSRIYIPMKGGIDSLNVSVSAAIIVFEAIRQRD